MINYNPLATIDDGSCTPFVYGCMVDSADNFDSLATSEEGITCFYTGCMDEIADNYLDVANIAAVCEYSGCMNTFACNYSEIATINVGCVFPETYYDCNNECLLDADLDGVCDALEISGCTDPLAINFEPLATDDDTSCYLPLEVTYTVNHAECKNDYGSIDLVITGGLEPIEINTFGLDLTAIPPGNGYVIYVSDASGNDYSFGGVDDNFTSI